MYKNCNTEYSALRQQQLEDHLLANMMQKPYSDISISDLCEQAHISRKSFYRYFGSKDGCLCALLDRILLDSSSYEYKGTSDVRGLELEFLRIFSFWKEQSQLLQILISNNLSSTLFEQMIQHFINEERQLLQNMGIVNVMKDDETLLFVTSGFLTILLNWADNGFEKSVDQLAASMSKLYQRPMVPSEFAE